MCVRRLSRNNIVALIRDRIDVAMRSRRRHLDGDVEDLRQDLFVAVWLRLRRVKLKRASLTSFIDLLIVHEIVDRQRHACRKKRRPSRRIESLSALGEVDVINRLARTIPATDQWEIAEDVAWALSQLAATETAILVEATESPVSSVARSRGLPNSTLRGQLRRIRSKLQKQLADYRPKLPISNP